MRKIYDRGRVGHKTVGIRHAAAKLFRKRGGGEGTAENDADNLAKGDETESSPESY